MTSLSRAVSGQAGLGLSQVYGFTKQSGGEINVKSRLGEGRTFCLFLPRVAAPSNSDIAVISERAVASEASVLVVVAEFATHLLADLGLTTRQVSNARDPLDLLEREHEDIDIVFSDVIMPGIDGAVRPTQNAEVWRGATTR